MTNDRGVIFDFDGVLIDSEPLHLRAFQEILPAFGRKLTEQEYYAQYIVYSDREVLERLLPAGETLEAALVAKERRYRELVEAGVPVFQDGLTLLSQTDGWRVGLATGSLRPEVERILRSLGIRERFGTIVTREDCRKGKPDPEPFLLAARALGLAPHRCVAIEDTPGGVQAAKAAGMACVAVTHSCRRDSLVGADLVVDDLAAVPLAAVLGDGGPRDPVHDAG
ncbi:MAG: HAD family phosphatase [candidate division NC10 bacterium]|nr:HAD family phosphatase [candidate division NC10 bacterium]MBI2115049.1 HAD family phosphatase [candidate division NC10 bacterium]MBI2164147.1 HAD family phosphatase [candidate division NC10 bacterium]MBI2562167.1 HAD family phosphatase [candidate division NC10 bacterium]